MKIIVLFFLIMSWKASFAQPCFEKTFGAFYNYEVGMQVYQLSDSSYLMMGLKYIPNDTLKLLKFSSNGNLLWEKNIDNIVTGSSYYYMYEFDENTFYITGEGVIRKIDSVGNLIWRKPYTINQINNSLLNGTADGGFVVLNTIQNNFLKVLLSKYDSSATLLQNDTIILDTLTFTSPLFVKELSDKSFIVGVNNDSNGVMHHITCYRVDTAGNTLWRKSITGDSIVSRYITVTTDTGFVIVGRDGITGMKIFLKRFDSNGDITADYVYTTNNTFAFYRLQVYLTSDKGYIIGCDIDSNAMDLHVIKIDSLGNQQWVKTFGGPYRDYFGSLVETIDHGFIICGTKYFNGNNQDYYLIKTDSIGVVDTMITNIFNLQTNKNIINIYPNPSHQNISIEVMNLQSVKVEIKITNLLGQLLLSKEESSFRDGYLLTTMNIENVPKGTYFVNVIGEREVIVRKVIIE